MRFSKTTGYKLTHAAGGCSCKKQNGQRRTSNTPCNRLLWIVASSIIPILCFFEYGEWLLMLYAQCHSNISSITAIISLWKCHWATECRVTPFVAISLQLLFLTMQETITILCRLCHTQMLLQSSMPNESWNKKCSFNMLAQSCFRRWDAV